MYWKQSGMIQNVLILRHIPQPSGNSSPVGGCFIFNGHSLPSNCTAFGPTGQLGKSFFGKFTKR